MAVGNLTRTSRFIKFWFFRLLSCFLIQAVEHGLRQAKHMLYMKLPGQSHDVLNRFFWKIILSLAAAVLSTPLLPPFQFLLYFILLILPHPFLFPPLLTHLPFLLFLFLLSCLPVDISFSIIIGGKNIFSIIFSFIFYNRLADYMILWLHTCMHMHTHSFFGGISTLFHWSVFIFFSSVIFLNSFVVNLKVEYRQSFDFGFLFGYWIGYYEFLPLSKF